MKKKSGIIISAIILLIVVIISGINLKKQIVQKKQVEEAINLATTRYDFIDDFELSGYLNSNIKLTVNEKFNDVKYKEKEDMFKRVYNLIGDAVIKSAVKNDIKVDTEQLVHSKQVSSYFDNKMFKYNFSGLSIIDDESDQQVASVNYTNEEVKEIVKNQLSNYKDIKVIDIFVEGNKKTTKLIMEDAFFDNTVKSQYKTLNEIYNDYTRTLRESGISSEGQLIEVVKQGNEYKSYYITDKKFELISYDIEISKYEIEEDENILDKFDSGKAAAGTYGKPTVNYSKTEYSKEPSDDDKSFAWVAAKKAVKEKLKAPSTAKFPFSYLNEDIKEVDINTFVVKSYVDAENSFGAKLRVDFMVKIKKTGENTYNILDVQLNE